MRGAFFSASLSLLSRVCIGDSRQPEDQVIYASAVVDQDGYATNVTLAGLPTNNISKENISHLSRQSGLRLRLVHYIVVARGYDDLMSLHGIEHLSCCFILRVNVHYRQVVLLARIDSNAVHQISCNHQIFHLRGEA